MNKSGERQEGIYGLGVGLLLLSLSRITSLICLFRLFVDFIHFDAFLVTRVGHRGGNKRNR